MKTLYESLLTGNVRKPSALAQPQSKEELEQLISEHIEKIKPHPGQEVNLNWIDISGVDDLSKLFRNTNYIPVIDTWKIDHVRNFMYMFADNKYIVRSPLPVLQKTLKAGWCYRGMFADCKSLKHAPALPATNLVEGCYASMFWGCKTLEVPPELPAKELEESCYIDMLRNCTSLKVAPELPAKKLEKFCYTSMFFGCTSLVHAPELPAVQLAPGCYSNMFCSCTSLEIAPELPAKNLVTSCYDNMFYCCSSLKEKAKVPSTVNTDNVRTCWNMYRDCPKIKD